ncbi:unnamed protein product [Symbiodinium microadriaticum]|nr:unnamed protein product [Symbiodinium microadriaticum]
MCLQAEEMIQEDRVKKEFPDAWEDGAVVDVEDDKDNELDGEVADPLGGKDSGEGPDGPGGGFAAPEAAPAMMVA